ncbi:ABC transporter substrate-binding protein [Massilia niastensis]|uniref:ABC transporter substrate-binding protein n=1 Tax=Massilia niastensis TaxID=544911 RepID=UPI00037584BF|nr:extracellular solute-binding protein [Massilia niastensis]
MRFATCWLLASLLFVAGAAQAQVPAYQGADRAQRLLKGARAEGTLNVYTSMAEKDSARLVEAFEKKTGIEVNVWRSGKNKVLQRVITEARAGRHEADVILNPAPEMEALHREKLLQPVWSPRQAELIPAALPAHREWTGMRVYLFAQPYNTRQVSAAEVPSSFEDLLHPRWRGRLGIEAKQAEWFHALVQAMGEEKGLRYFRELVATSAPSLRTGSSLLNNMVVSGEVPLALNVYSYLPEQARAAGAPVDYVVLSPAVAYTDGIGIARRAAHPHAATLFYDFLLDEGQAIVAGFKALTTDKRDQALLARYKPVYIDPVSVLDNYEKWTSLYDDTLNGRVKGDQK